MLKIALAGLLFCLLPLRSTRAEAPASQTAPTEERFAAALRDDPRWVKSSVTWARPLPAGRAAWSLVEGEIADARGRREGVLALVEDGEAPRLLARTRSPLPETLTWQVEPGPDVDADGRGELIGRWRETVGARQRDGLLIARTSPPAVVLMELGRAETGPAATACFLPVAGRPGHALAIEHRGTPETPPMMEIFLPRADGAFAREPVFGAVFSAGSSEGEAVKAWRRAFQLAPTVEPLADSGRVCPGPGVVVSSASIGGRDAARRSVLGPLAVTAAGVRAAVARLGRGGPEAILVLKLEGRPVGEGGLRGPAGGSR